MASLRLITPLFLLTVMALPSAQCHTLKANISCLDCRSNHYDFSGNKIVVKCEKVKTLAITTTEADGSFETTLPTDASNSERASSTNCIARLVGGPHQLYASRKDMASTVVKATNSNFFTITTALKFSTTKQHRNRRPTKEFAADSKTVDLPLPPEWGLPPSSFYLPVLPIIGIP